MTTLLYSVKITGDASGLKQAAGEAKGQLADLGQAAARTNAQVAAAEAGSFGTGSPRAGSPSPAPASPPQGLRPDQWKNLGFQANDVATSLASGMPIMQVLAQQGGQVLGVLQDGPGGVAGSLKTIGERLLGLVSPARLAFGGIALAAVGATLATKSYLDSLDAVERSLYGRGRASGMTVGGINAAASANAGMQTGLTAGEGRSILSAFARTGRIGPEMGGELAKVTRDFAFTTGTDVQTATETIAKSFSSLSKGGARELADAFGGVSDETVRMIERLDESGNRFAAQKAQLDALRPSLVSYGQQMGFWAREWELFKQQGSSAWEGVGGTAASFFNVDSLEQQLERAKRLVGSPLGYFVDPTNGFRSAQTEVERLTALIDKLGAAGKKTAADLASVKLGDAVVAASPDLAARQSLSSRLAQLSDPEGVAGLSPALREERTRAIERTRAALEGYLDTDEKARRSDALTLASIRARTAEEHGWIAAQQKAVELSGESVEASERRRRAAQAETEVLERAKKVSEDNLRSARDALAATGLQPYQRALAELDADDRRRREAARGSGGEAAEAAATAAKRRAIDVDMLGGPLRQSALSLNEQTAALRTQRDSFYASAEQAGYLAERQRLINEYTRAGVTDLSALMPQIEGLARGYGQAAGAADKFTRASQNAVQGMDELRSGTRGGITGVFSDLRQGKDPTQNLLSNLGSMTDRFFDRTVARPLTEQLLGFDGKGGGGSIGDSVSKFLFGDVTKAGDLAAGKMPGLAGLTTGVMNVTATTVTLAGFTGSDTASIGSILSGGPKDIRLPGSPGSGDDTDALAGTRIRFSDLPFDERSVRMFNSGQGALQRDFYPDLNRELTARGDSLVQTLDRLGEGVRGAGSGLVDALGSVVKGLGSGSGFGNLFGGGSAFQDPLEGVSLFDKGGYTGSFDPRMPVGVVHGGEYVFDAPATTRIGVSTLEAIRRGMAGYQSGGYVGQAPGMADGGATFSQTNIINGSGLSKEELAEVLDEHGRNMIDRMPGLVNAAVSERFSRRGIR